VDFLYKTICIKELNENHHTEPPVQYGGQIGALDEWGIGESES
jgi:hypothetical protein